MEITLTEAGAGDDASYVRPRALSESELNRAAEMLDRAWNSGRMAHRAALTEAMVDGDFRNAVFDVLDRETQDQYQAATPVWQGFATRKLVNNFLPHRVVELRQDMSALPNVPELTPYPERKTSKSKWDLQVRKKGARYAFSWEAFVNDQLGELQELPGALATAAVETEAREAALLLTDGDGPNAAFFNSTAIVYDDGTTGSNLMTGNPALTTTSLTTALTTIRSRRGPDGRPLNLPRLTLVVAPSLEIQARSILAATTIRTTVGAAEVESANWLRGVVDLAVDPWLQAIDLGAAAATTWYIVPTPGTSRIALAVGFLRGHEQPQVRIKGGQGQIVGGGAIDPRDGTFEIDDIQYRVRHVLGSALGDPRGTIASTGAGS